MIDLVCIETRLFENRHTADNFNVHKLLHTNLQLETSSICLPDGKLLLIKSGRRFYKVWL